MKVNPERKPNFCFALNLLFFRSRITNLQERDESIAPPAGYLSEGIRSVRMKLDEVWG
jgi:hypothetical protein